MAVIKRIVKKNPRSARLEYNYIIIWTEVNQNISTTFSAKETFAHINFENSLNLDIITLSTRPIFEGFRLTVFGSSFCIIINFLTS